MVLLFSPLLPILYWHLVLSAPHYSGYLQCWTDLGFVLVVGVCVILCYSLGVAVRLNNLRQNTVVPCKIAEGTKQKMYFPL